MNMDSSLRLCDRWGRRRKPVQEASKLSARENPIHSGRDFAGVSRDEHDDLSSRIPSSY